MERIDGIEQQLREFERNVGLVFSGTGIEHKVGALIRGFRSDREQLESNRGLHLPTIGFFGPKDNGKSEMLRSLFFDEKRPKGILSGVGSNNKTMKVTWIGAKAPYDLSPEWEVHLPADTASDTRLGIETILVDIPGFNDADPQAMEAAERARTSCQIKVLVVRSDQMEDRAVMEEATKLDGHVIVPILNMLRWRSDSPEAQNHAMEFLARLRSSAPNSRIYEPLRITQVDIPGLNHDGLDSVGEALAASLKKVIAQTDREPDLVGKAVVNRFEDLRRELESEMESFLLASANSQRQIEEAIGTFPVEVIQELEGSDRALASAAKLGIRAELLRKTSSLFFPYRSVLGLLCLTTGAWDKLALAFSGSIPSLAMSTYQAVKNLKDRTSKEPAAMLKATERVAQQFRSKLAQPISDFAFSIRHVSEGNELHLTNEVTVEGLDHVLELSKRAFEEETTNGAPNGFTTWFGGFCATFVFLAILAGPLVSVYWDYGQAAYETFTTDQNTPWTEYPAPSFGMMFTALILGLIPVVAIAILMLSWASRGGVVRRCIRRIQNHHEEGIARLREDRSLAIELTDPVLKAARMVGRFVRE